MSRIFLSAVVLLASSFALADCLGEAQIIAKVGSINKKTMLSCRVNIEPASIIQYNMNMNCPLDIDEVLANGVEVGLKDGHDCRLDVGDSVSGVLYKDSVGRIGLE